MNLHLKRLGHVSSVTGGNTWRMVHVSLLCTSNVMQFLIRSLGVTA